MLEIFQFEFMIRAFIAGAVIAVIAPLIGNFLVVRRYSLMADTLAHVALAGVAIGILLSTQPVVTAVLVTVAAALSIDQLRSERKILGDSVLAIFLSGSLAFAAVLLSIAKGFNANLFSFLFGSISTVSQLDLSVVLILGVTVIIIILLLYKEFFFSSFDEELAKANGLPVRALNRILIMLTAVTVALAMRIVGVLLIGALMVIPVITAMQFGRGFRATIITSILFSAAAIFIGLFASYYLDLASGGTIVMVSILLFLPSLVVRKGS